MEIKGEVEDIIYKNETNGYTIASFYMQNADTVIVGYLPFVNKGDSLKVVGRFVTHPDYGEQFKVETFEKIMPETLDALERYLANGVIKGIGPATAQKIIKKFGESTLEILRNEPEELAKIKGITKAKANEISESFIENWELWQIVGFLEKFGISAASAQTIYKRFGADTISKIEEDPYILGELSIKVDFTQIDKMALSIGIEKNNLRRIGSGIRHALNLASFNGHACVLEANLIAFVTRLLGISEEDVLDGIKDLRAKEQIAVETREEIATVDGKTEMSIQDWIYLIDYYKTEKNIANKIISLEQSENLKKIDNIEKEIKKITEIKLSEKQKEAIKQINENNVTIITGGPGTGKTTIIKTIIDLYKNKGKKVVLCAPTGRAAKRMTEATGEEAKTLHRLLEIGKLSDEKPNPDMDVTPIDADIIIIDEVSMVDMFLMNYVMKAIFKGTKLILVGDIDQLPSVGPGSVLKDLIESKRVPYTTLNKIFRQAAKSKIVVNSHKVNDGINFFEEIDEDEETLDDFDFIPENNQKKVQEMILDMYTADMQIITPTKKGDLGTKTLNQLLQEKYNPYEDYKVEKKFGDIIYREGDKVMQIKNNYDMTWVRGLEVSSGIFNGEMGQIIEIDNSEGKVKIKFDDDKIAIYETADLEQIEHSFAITVHKSQGSEFNQVIFPIMQVAPMLLTRNLLYTGMTRAKNRLVIIGSKNAIEFMIRNVNTKKRNTGLKYKLQEIE